jgi:hypothetical protein
LKQALVQESRQSQQELKQHVSTTNKASTDHLSNQMMSLELQKQQKARSETLLNSVKFHGMNERRNQVNDPHPKTFRWIFSEELVSRIPSILRSDFN